MAELRPHPVTVDCLVPECGQVTLDVPILSTSSVFNKETNALEVKLEPDLKAALVQYKAHLAEVHPDVPIAPDAFPDDIGSG
jgi:hypothetical protein